MARQREIKKGETLYTIAAEEGFDPAALWEHPDNANGIGQKRDNPGVLAEGDIVIIPDRKPRKETIASGKKHTFRRKGLLKKLKIALREQTQVQAGQRYTLEPDIGKPIEGTVDDEGIVEARLSSHVRRARLTVGKPPHRHVIELRIGGLDPHEELSGAQSRLNQLGYHAGPADGADTEQTRAALRSFQHEHGLDASGTLDFDTARALRKEHGA